MIEVQTTAEFDSWMGALRDRTAVAKVAARIMRVAHGLMGDVKPVGKGISELRVDHGPGYRVYFIQRGAVVIVLLCGGDKATQQRDIKAAHKIAASL